MKTKTTAGVLVAALVVALAGLPAHAGGRKERRVMSGDYSRPAGVWAFSGDAGAAALTGACDGQGCVAFPVPEGATTVSLEIADSSGESPVALISGVGEEGSIVTCDASTGPIPLEDLAAAQARGDYDPEHDGPPRVTVTLAIGLCDDGSLGLATSGTVTATFSAAG